MNALFLVSMIVEAIFGFGFLIAPGALMAPMGVSLDETATVFARLFGSAILSFPVLLWFVRKSTSAEFRLVVVTSLFVYYLLSTILLLMTQLRGLMNPMGWSVVVLHLALSLWFGYFLIKKMR
jgi:hypothetical protein